VRAPKMRPASQREAPNRSLVPTTVKVRSSRPRASAAAACGSKAQDSGSDSKASALKSLAKDAFGMFTPRSTREEVIQGGGGGSLGAKRPSLLP